MTVTRHESGDEYGVLSVDIAEDADEVLMSVPLLRDLITELNMRAPRMRDAEQRGYTRGYNAHAASQQRALAEYGGRPSKPKYDEVWALLRERMADDFDYPTPDDIVAATLDVARDAIDRVPDRCDAIGGYSFDEAIAWSLAEIDRLRGA